MIALLLAKRPNIRFGSSHTWRFFWIRYFISWKIMTRVSQPNYHLPHRLKLSRWTLLPAHLNQRQNWKLKTWSLTYLLKQVLQNFFCYCALPRSAHVLHFNLLHQNIQFYNFWDVLLKPSENYQYKNFADFDFHCFMA